MSAASYTLEFSWSRPPLTANQRMHWAHKAKVTAEVREQAAWKANLIPPMKRCRVELVWRVRDSRRRDVDNVVPTLKAICDGIVDAGVVPDDTPEFMVKVMPEIVRVPTNSAGGLTVTVTEIEAAA